MKKIVLLLTFVVTFYSCEENLDRLPNDSLVSDTAYRTVDDLNLGLNGVFSFYTNRNIITFNSVFTDESKIGADNGGQQVILYNQVLDATTGGANAIWNGHYAVIARANRIIDASALITPTAAELAKYNNIVGQCYAIRALCHLDLLNHYTEDPTDLNSLAVPYVDRVITVGLPRNTVQEVHDFILADLDLAAANINNTSLTFATPNFLEFVRAKLFFLTGNYAQALSSAQELIDVVALADVNVPIDNPTRYENIFNDTNTAEIIFSRLRTNTEVFMGGTWYFTGTGGAFLEMSNKMYNAMDKTLDDPTAPIPVFIDVRTRVLFDRTQSSPDDNFHLINKYPGSNGLPFFNQEKNMRISEMHLIKAECQARLNNFAGAAQTIKALRDKRYMTGTEPGLDVYSNMSEAAVAILAERNLELGYEGHRYVDLKRLRFDVNSGIVRDPADCGGATPCILGVTDHRFVLPIPQNEVDVNSSMIQNPVY